MTIRIEGSSGHAAFCSLSIRTSWRRLVEDVQFGLGRRSRSFVGAQEHLRCMILLLLVAFARCQW